MRREGLGVRDSGGRVRASESMKTSAFTLVTGFRSSVVRLMAWRGGRLQDVTNSPHADVLATVAGLTADVLTQVRNQDVPAIIGELERIKLALTARLAGGPTPTVSDDGDTLVDVDEAARITGMSPDWLYRNWADIPGARKLSPRALRFSRKGLDKWMAQGGRRRA